MSKAKTLREWRENEAQQIGFGEHHPDFADTVAASVDKKVERVFRKYRAAGYPHYRFTPERARREMEKLMRVNTAELITADGVIMPNNAGLALAWSRFPHAIDVRCGKMERFHGAVNARGDFRHIETLRLALSSLCRDGMKTEPVYVWGKL